MSWAGRVVRRASEGLGGIPPFVRSCLGLGCRGASGRSLDRARREEGARCCEWCSR